MSKLPLAINALSQRAVITMKYPGRHLPLLISFCTSLSYLELWQIILQLL